MNHYELEDWEFFLEDQDSRPPTDDESFLETLSADELDWAFETWPVENSDD